MKVVPLNDKIVVKRLEAEDKTAGGILLPDSAKEKPKQGKILSVGDGKLLENGKRANFQVRDMPVTSATRVIPPRPSANASAAAQCRRIRSVIAPDSNPNFSRKVSAIAWVSMTPP